MDSSKPKVLLRSLIISYLFSAILLLALTFLFYKLKLKEAQINAAVCMIYVLVCFFGGILAGKGIRSRRFFWGMLTGLLYFIVLYGMSWAMSKGTMPDISRSMTVMACCIGGGTLGGMLS